jgi:hypothetical protein
MAIWDLAVAFDALKGGRLPSTRAKAEFLILQGVPQALIESEYPSLQEACLQLMGEGWEPFSAHRWDDADLATPPPKRDFVWFRREVKGQTGKVRPGGTATEAPVPKPR